ncbi:MAG: TonB-dependent receptor [Acidobacteriia bacterium]|nr:TonB-dependent receptor [Terriglobia bacterium]
MLRATRLIAVLIAGGWSILIAQPESASWQGTLRDAGARPVINAVVRLENAQQTWVANTDSSGIFRFASLAPGSYSVSVLQGERAARLQTKIDFPAGAHLETLLELTTAGGAEVLTATQIQGTSATGGEHLSSRRVAGLPLNKRDFSQLLLLASGTQTDTNGAANFTQQFAVNGQRGTAAVFAMDGIDSTDPEMGGATFSNFNVDAIQEIQASSGVLPAEIGHGAGSFTDIITKSGTDQIHGAVFEFVRNAAFDARNFFDRRSVASPGRLPPFQRNEFGFTNGGPVVLPGIYDGRGRTYYFGQYQGFRQVLGTTQVFPVPTPDERRGLDSTAFPGDTLRVPVNAQIASILARYPLPNDAQGPYGARTHATSSKVTTVTDQFSIRIDHRISDKAQLFGRFNLNNVTGPVTNPDQTAIDASFGIRFLDRQRNLGLTYTRNVSPHLILEFSLGYIRSTPLFPPSNHNEPGILFGDSSYEAFNAPGGTITGTYGNLYQGRQNVTYIHGSHTLKAGFEARWNRDTTVFGLSPNGQYTFGGGTAYATVPIVSQSGRHNIQPGDPLPDSMTGFLTATPFSYTIAVSPAMFPQGDHIGWTGVQREAYGAYLQDTWKAAARLTINYGLRYEVSTPIHEPADRTSGPVFANVPGGGVEQKLLVNLQPGYIMDWNGWGPHLAVDYQASPRLALHAAGSLTTVLANLFQDDFLTAGTPFVVLPYISAKPGAPVPFENTISQFNLPVAYTPAGQAIFATGRTTDVPPNTVMDVQRYEEDLAAATPGHQIRALTEFGNDRNFRNGYVATYTAGFDRDFGEVKWSAGYVATVGVKLDSLAYPNSYGGADPAFAPFTKFDAKGRVLGGFGNESIVTNRSHSTFHSLQTSVQKTSARAGLGFQASYTFSKSLDDVSAVLGGLPGSTSGTLQQTAPQNPWDTRAEKGPSTFDVRHALTFNLVEELPFDHWWRPNRLTSGWQLFGLSAFASGAPFTVYSGIQQTGAGSMGADRPDQLGRPVLSTSRTVREDYFGLGAANASLFSIPLDVPGGTGPNHGRFGTLGRNTFRGPLLHNVDISLIKETPLVREALKLQFRAEVFNVFNLVNLGLPANIVLGPGFGLISRTAAPSRQIQFSLKLLY